MRTLVISDLHLGARLGHDVLTRPAPLARLLEELDRVDRLVLLGDVVELMEGRPAQAMAKAEPVIRAIGRRLRGGSEVIVVPGNHDLPLIRPWIRADPRRLTIETPVPPDATPRLAQLLQWLAPADVRVRYPGVWLDERTWATHGHYLDRHLLPESSYGISRGLFGGLPSGPALPANYEHVHRLSLGPFKRFLPRIVAALLDDAADLLRASTMPSVRRHVLNRRLAPLTSALLALQMRRASIPVTAHIAARLGVHADWLIFGHVHRLGPLPGDEPEHWRGGPDGPSLLNTGSWCYEPLLVHRATLPHPYWPGGGVVLEDRAEPRAVSLLEGLTPAELRGGALP